MTLLKRATIKSYDAGSHRAAVGISGSLAVWLDGIALSDSIPAAAVVAGRECAVLFHEDDNPADAVIVSVHGGGPATPITDFLGLTDTPGSYSGQSLKQVRVNAGETALEFAAAGGGGGDEIVDADGDTKVQVEESADEDIIRFDTAGTERMVIDEDGYLGLVKPSGHTVGGILPFTQYGLYLSGNVGPASAAAGQDAATILASQTLTSTADGQKFYGVTGQATVSTPNYDVTEMAGIRFTAIAAGGSIVRTITDQIGAQVLIGKFGGGKLDFDDMTGFKDGVGFMTTINTTIDRWNSFWANYGGSSAITTHSGLRITDVTAGTNKYLIWAGPNTPSATGVTNLRLDAGNPPNAASATEGDSQLYLTFMENGSLAMRQVRWKQNSSLAAGDKVMIAV